MRIESKTWPAQALENADARNHRRRADRAPPSDSPPEFLSPRSPILVKRLGHIDYEPAWHAMREFTMRRAMHTADELWILQHPPVYTLGIAARTQHLPRLPNGIPVVKTDRGGQITYHGPGQLVVYVLIDLRRHGLTVRPLVRLMENAVIDLLAGYAVAARGSADAPGVYVGNAKVAALGLRIRNGCCYHGLALNVDMDLRPFQAIDPCGYPGLKVTQTRDLGIADGTGKLGAKLADHLLLRLHAKSAEGIAYPK